MKILHVATLISPSGEYGGPVRVACGQVQELGSRGHLTVLAAAARGFSAPLPQIFDGAPVALFTARNLLPKLGFATTTAPGMVRWFIRHRGEFDLVHIHLARDLVTLPIAILCRLWGIPYVLQTHGMVDPSPKVLAKVLDAVAVKRVLRGAAAVLHLRPVEEQELWDVAGAALNTVFVPNGLRVGTQQVSDPPAPVSVLFLARLQARKRPLAFIEAARTLHRKHPEVEFRIIGPDEGEGQAVDRAIRDTPLDGRLRWDGPVDPAAALAAIRDGSVYALPSNNEPFPMTVLEAMSVGRPVVINHDCGLAPVVEQYGAGIVCSDSGPTLAEALDTLLTDQHLRTRTGRAGYRLVRDHLSLDRVADRLEEIYSAAVTAADSAPTPEPRGPHA